MRQFLEVKYVTVLQLYDLALALLNETDTDAKDYPRLKLPYINNILAKTFAVENWIRRSNNTPLLAEIPTVHSDEDVLPYNAQFVRVCLPYALAAMFAIDEDRDLANVYSRIYEEMEGQLLHVLSDEIYDVYGEV